jgi:hypothetical protein
VKPARALQCFSVSLFLILRKAKRWMFRVPSVPQAVLPGCSPAALFLSCPSLPWLGLGLQQTQEAGGIVQPTGQVLAGGRLAFLRTLEALWGVNGVPMEGWGSSLP